MDMFTPWNKIQLEAILRQVIDVGIEGAKHDMKHTLDIATPKSKVDLALDISAIANTDSSAVNGYGFLIIGATRDGVKGGFDRICSKGTDSLSATLVNILKEWIAPVPRIHVVQFEDSTAGSWGAIVIEPSENQPHIFIRDYNTSPIRGDWYVRVSDINQRARPEDYSRVLSKAITQALSPVILRLEETNRRLALAEEKIPNLLSVIDSFFKTNRPESEDAISKTSELNLSPLEKLRRRLRDPDDEIEEIVQNEISQVLGKITSAHDLPWKNPNSMEEAKALLEKYVEISRPLIELTVSLTRYKKASGYIEKFVHELELISIVPEPPPGPFQQGAQNIRVLPAALALVAFIWSCILNDKPNYIIKLLSATYRDRQNRREFPIFDLWRKVSHSYEIFNMARGRGSYVASEFWFRDTLLPLLSNDYPRIKQDSFFEVEFILTLVFELVSRQPSMAWLGQVYMIGGTYLYFWDAREVLENFIRKRSSFLETIFGGNLKSVLEAFDNKSTGAVARDSGGGNGFLSGALAAYTSGKQSS